SLAHGLFLAAKAGANNHIFQHTHAAQWAHDLVGARQAEMNHLIGRAARDVLSPKSNGSRVGFENSVHQIEQSRFSSAVGANQSQYFALAQIEAHVGNSLQSAKTLADPANLEKIVHSITSRDRGASR